MQQINENSVPAKSKAPAEDVKPATPNWLSRTLVWNPVYYTLCTSDERFQAILEHCEFKQKCSFLSAEDSEATTWQFESDSGRCVCIVNIPALPDREDQLEVVGLIAHEAVHVWQKVRQHLSIEAVEAIGEEFEAYALQGIIQELLMEYRKQVYEC